MEFEVFDKNFRPKIRKPLFEFKVRGAKISLWPLWWNLSFDSDGKINIGPIEVIW